MDKNRWEYKKFEDALLKVKYTRKIQNSDYLPNGIVPVVSQEETFISGYWDNRDDAFKVDSPVVIFGDHSRVVKYVDFDFVLGADGVKILKPINGLNARFFYHFLKWYDVPSLGYSRHYKLLKEIYVPIPPLSEQQHIVEELDLLSSIIEKKKAQLNELDNLAQSLFYEMFGDPITNEIASLSDVVEIKSSLVSPSELPYSEMLHVSPANIISGTGEIINCMRAKDENLISGKYTFSQGDILYSKIRPNLNKVAIPNFSGICSADMYPLTVKEKANSVYLWRLLLGKDFLEYAIKHSGRARMPKLNRETLFAYKFPLPPIDLQNQFASKIEAIEHQKELIKQSIKEVETLFNSRMDYYFN